MLSVFKNQLRIGFETPNLCMLAYGFFPVFKAIVSICASSKT
jgi:hypothetical protein